MAALVVARVTVKDLEKFQQYSAKAGPTMAEFGGEPLFRAKADKNLTSGGEDHQITGIFKFPSLEKVDEWYGSDAYQSLSGLRNEAADIQFISYELMG